jgi:hypothetical protein
MLYKKFLHPFTTANEEFMYDSIAGVIPPPKTAEEELVLQERLLEMAKTEPLLKKALIITKIIKPD